jgi:teichuronic acid biosynthesis glycosyltransferase TuaH
VQVVVFSEVKWGYLRTRKRFLLSRFPADWPILFLEPMNRVTENHLRPVREGRMVIATVPILKPKTTFGWLNALLGSALGRRVLLLVAGIWTRLVIQRHARGRPRVFLVSNVLFAPLALGLERDLVVYDANDDPLGFPGAPPWMGPALDRTLGGADVVVSCSSALRARLLARGARDVKVIGNGVEVEHFGQAVDPGLVPAPMRTLKRPRIGYAGAIAEWFDFDLVADVAGAYPDIPIVLAGPVAPPVRERAAALARDHANVTFIGPVPYETLPHVVGALDVGLIPFRMGPATNVLNPNKLYEYLAAGVTVVTLNFSVDVQGFAPWIRIAEDRASFVAAVGEALAQPMDRDALRRIAAGESWDRRAAAFVDLIQANIAHEGKVASGE